MAHISKGVSDELRKTYAAMIKDLQKLPVHIMFLKLTAEQIKNRSQHHERGVDWKRHLKDRLKHEGFSTIVDRYLNEQKVMLEALRKQSISYGIHNLS